MFVIEYKPTKQGVLLWRTKMVLSFYNFLVAHAHSKELKGKGFVPKGRQMIF